MAVSKRIIFAIVAVVIVVVVILAIIIVPYNSLVSKDQDVKNKWDTVKVEINRQVQVTYQITNQENISMYYEQSVLTSITTLRTQWLNTIANASLEEQVNVSHEFAVQLGSFLSITEGNQELNSIDVIQQVIDELVGNQNRIAVAQIRYNDAVTAYNTEVRGFPGFITAGMFGFSQAPYFYQET